MEHPIFDLKQVRQLFRSDLLTPLHESRQPRQEFRILQSHQSIEVPHALPITCVFARPINANPGVFTLEISPEPTALTKHPQRDASRKRAPKFELTPQRYA